jgi:hypothetical protein
MVRANALFIVLVISLLIALISSSLILVSYHYSTIHFQARLYKRLLSNAQSGINYLLAEEGDLNLNEEKILDLYGKEKDSISLKRMNWGIFDLAVVRAFSGNQHVIKVLEYGYKPDGETKSAIYLSDMSWPLILSGNTLIKGNCYLPKSGVKGGVIENLNFAGVKLINGEIRESKESLPTLKTDIKNKLVDLIEKKYRMEDFDLITNAESDTIRRSFAERTVLLKQHTRLGIKNLIGNIIIVSDTILKIDRNSILEDVIIVAKAVEVENGFKGRLQIFATDSILLNSNVELQYPSVVGLLKRDIKVMHPFVKILRGCKINGVVFSTQILMDSKQPCVYLEKDALVHGLIYVDGIADIQGVVYGSVLCNKFRYKSDENFLVNATIDVTKLSPHFVGSGLLISEKKKRVIRWLE